MKNATYLGLCLMATSFGLVAVALGQQGTDSPFGVPSTSSAPVGQLGSPNQQPGAQDQFRQPAAFDQPAASSRASGSDDPLFDTPSASDQPNSATSSSAPQDRSLLSSPEQPSGAWSSSTRPPRGEIGVWMIESGGPGVEVTRITSGSAAEQAGLRSGDIILLVNGRGASSPQSAASLIRQVPIGQAATLTIWRDGNQQQMQVMMQPARQIARDDSYQVNRSASNSQSSDLASRTIRLEQQLNSVMQELQQLRQELTQLRAAGAQPASYSAESKQDPYSNPGAAQPTETTAPPPGFGQPDEPAAPPSTQPEQPSAEPQQLSTPPTGENSATPDPFGNDAAPPKDEEAPKVEEPKADETDSLFQ